MRPAEKDEERREDTFLKFLPQCEPVQAGSTSLPYGAVTLPAGFKAFELLDEEVLQNFGTLVEG